MINTYVAIEKFCCLQDFLPKPEKFMKLQICTTLINLHTKIFNNIPSTSHLISLFQTYSNEMMLSLPNV
jgi:hypothetical protein